MNKNAGRLGTGGGPQQAAAIAFRGTDRGVEVCLIRKRNSQTWGIPKGMVDPGDTLEETALNETWEEAGMDGRLVGAPVGKYEYEKWESTFTVPSISWKFSMSIQHGRRNASVSAAGGRSTTR